MASVLTEELAAKAKTRQHEAATGAGRCIWSYFFLVLFVVFFLTPPIYMLITSLKSSAEIGAITNPWWVYHPTLENYKALLTSDRLPDLLHATRRSSRWWW